MEKSVLSAEVAEFEYLKTDSFRLVPPYYFDFSTRVKQRWIGRKVLDVFHMEFPYYSREYYVGSSCFLSSNSKIV